MKRLCGPIFLLPMPRYHLRETPSPSLTLGVVAGLEIGPPLSRGRPSRPIDPVLPRLSSTGPSGYCLCTAFGRLSSISPFSSAASSAAHIEKERGTAAVGLPEISAAVAAERCRGRGAVAPPRAVALRLPAASTSSGPADVLARPGRDWDGGGDGDRYGMARPSRVGDALTTTPALLLSVWLLPGLPSPAAA